MLVLSRADIAAVIDMGEVIEAVQTAHGEHAAGRASQPTRTSVAVPGTESAILPMTAALAAPPAAGIKLLSIFPDNAAAGLPPLSAVIVLVDLATGRCSAVLEGGLLTAYRTAAASAVATRQLAREDSTVLGLIGAGLEARTHLDAIRLVRPIETVAVWSRTSATATAFAEDVADRGIAVRIEDDPEAVVRAAHVLCTLTPSPTPIVKGAWLQPGTHVNAVGTHWIDKREVDTEAVARARVVVDSHDANVRECGDLMIPVAEGAIELAHFADEIGEVVNGEKPGRTGMEITMYQSVGVAIQDVATARLIAERAKERRIGTEIDLW
jgi:ornithine cyclodeaminase/alanine dehydrogenase